MGWKQMLKVMVVDDSSTLRLVLRKQLIELGITSISMATDGKEALEMLGRDTDFDLIMCDWHMEPMDGLTFCAKVQETPELKGRYIPILLMTADDKLANNDRKDRMLPIIKRLGIIGILRKPFSHDDIKTILSRSAASSGPRPQPD